MEEMETTGYRLSVEGKTGEEATIRLAGRLSLDDLEPLMADLQAIPGRLKPRRLSVDLAGVEYLDSAGALALIELENLARSLTIPFEPPATSPGRITACWASSTGKRSSGRR